MARIWVKYINDSAVIFGPGQPQTFGPGQFSLATLTFNPLRPVWHTQYVKIFVPRVSILCTGKMFSCQCLNPKPSWRTEKFLKIIWRNCTDISRNVLRKTCNSKATTACLTNWWMCRPIRLLDSANFICCHNEKIKHKSSNTFCMVTSWKKSFMCCAKSSAREQITEI